jgi:hypothetical protein
MNYIVIAIALGVVLASAAWAMEARRDTASAASNKPSLTKYHNARIQEDGSTRS